MANLKLRGYQRIYTITEEEGLEIKEIWKDDKYRFDYKIDIGPIGFRKSDIQIIEMGDEVSAKRGIDLADPIQREEVSRFEKEYTEFMTAQPKEKQTLEHYIKHKKVASFFQPRIAQSGMERFNQGKTIIHNPIAFQDIWQKQAAMTAMQAYTERNMPEHQEFRDTKFSADEINVKEIPF